jgi:hypothetical protein
MSVWHRRFGRKPAPAQRRSTPRAVQENGAHENGAQENAAQENAMQENAVHENAVHEKGRPASAAGRP